MMRTAIVSAADARYWGLLSDLLDSIEHWRPPSADSPLEICIFDVGLTPEQRRTLDRRVTRVVEPHWDFDFPAKANAPSYTRSQLARPFLPRYFPGYERFIWLDADLWLQDWRAMELLLMASAKPVMAIIPETHHAYAHNYMSPRERLAVWEHYAKSHGEKSADLLGAMPIINSGVWAMRSDTAYWDIWAQHIADTVKTFAGHLSEQCALNMAIYRGLIPYYPLPAWCNWVCCQAPPVFDPQTKRFYEPLLPHEPISIVHLIDVKDREAEVQCLDGSLHRMRLTYSHVWGS